MAIFTGAYQGILSLDGKVITDGNRADLQISYERIENRERMASGRLRINYIDSKMKLSTSWSNIFSDNTTVDGYKGAAYLRDLYDSKMGNSFPVVVTAKNVSSTVSTSITGNSNNTSLPQSTIYVVSNTGFTVPGYISVKSNTGNSMYELIYYTGTGGTAAGTGASGPSFTGCTGSSSGTLYSGSEVVQAGTSETVTMVFSSFEYTVVKRGPDRDIVNISVELEEL